MDPEIVEVQDWRCEQTPYINSASRNRRGDDVEVYVEPTSVDITIRGGYGYESYTASCSIPMEVMVRMIQHAGYTVVPPSVQESEGSR